MSEEKIKNGLSYEKNDADHIVISGDIKFTSISTFLVDMYH